MTIFQLKKKILFLEMLASWFLGAIIIITFKIFFEKQAK